MNPLTWLKRIRKFERLVHGGSQEVPNSVYDPSARTSGESRSTREPVSHGAIPLDEDPGITLSVTRFDCATGKIINERRS